MTKHNEIREGIYKAVFNYDMALLKHEGNTERKGLIRVHFIEDLLSYLHSQGVVLKDRYYGMGMDTRGGYNWKKLYFIIPLIEEE